MTQTMSATDFTIVRQDSTVGAATVNRYAINIVTAAGETLLKNTTTGETRYFSTRSSARKAITRLRRSLQK